MEYDAKDTHVPLVTGMTILFWGCPIRLDHPLGEPDKTILPNLIGMGEYECRSCCESCFDPAERCIQL